MTTTTSTARSVTSGGHTLPVSATSLPASVPGEARFVIAPNDLRHACRYAAQELGGRLATMVGEDDRAQSGSFRLSYIFALPDRRWLTLETLLDAANPVFPSVTPDIPAANWYEREVQDLLGLVPLDHPDPRRLVLHDDWPDGVYPLRADFDPRIPVPRAAREPYRFHNLHGDGIVEIPVGPIHAGVIEPGHFRFAAVGELILHLETRLFYTHRGIEKLAEGKSPEHVLQLAERICGVCACSHAVAYCQAIEQIAEAEIPPRAVALRTLFLELERVYNHVGDLGNICAGIGFAIGAAYGARLKDDLQRLNERLTGHRFLRGVCRPGGVRRDLSAASYHDVRDTLARIAREFQEFISILMGSDTAVERLTRTGHLPMDTARALGVVGVAARASGLDLDCRRDHPYGFYHQLPEPVPVPVRTDGDVLARVLVRMDEVIASLALIRATLDVLPEGPVYRAIGPLPSDAVGYAVTESPRGEHLHWVRTGPGNTIRRYRVRSASYCNWPAVAAAVPGNMVPDFPLINKSFELCYACLDR
ncbi:MAG: formate hydrogenlyase [Thermomicrobiales bacterium]|nr:MAG: formate hydrogenlyase [Thermomicrobiales bacterium]